MEYFEMTITVYLMKNINYTESFEVISKNINRAMLSDRELSELHIQNKFKNYVYNSFFPTEKDKIYKAGKIYIFNLRSIDKVFVNKLNGLLRKVNNGDFKVLSIEQRVISKHIITSLTAITPVIVTVQENKNWVIGDDLELLQKRLGDNLEKKYNSLYEDKLNVNGEFIERIEFLNKIPISINYKNTKLLGNKFKIYVKTQEESQRLAFIAEAIGIGEKGSSIGAGFCNAQYLK